MALTLMILNQVFGESIVFDKKLSHRSFLTSGGFSTLAALLSLTPPSIRNDSLYFLMYFGILLQEEYEFLDSLPRNLRHFSSIDSHYANLSTKLHSLQPTDPFYQIIATAVRNTGSVEVEEVRPF